MDEPFINTEHHSSTRKQERSLDTALTKDDSREMTELASDTQSEKTGKMMMQMDEYDIITTEPTAGRYGKRALLKRKLFRQSKSQRRAVNTWSGNRPRQQSADGDNSTMPPTESTLRTGYHSLEDRDEHGTTAGTGGSAQDNPTLYSDDDDDIYPDSSINYIQQIYARERFGECRHRKHATRHTGATTVHPTRMMGHNSPVPRGGYRWVQATQQGNSYDEPFTNHLQYPATGIDDGSSSMTEFIPVESMGARDMSTAQALHLCRKYVLRPYNIFLKFIGWRPMFSLTRMERISYYKKVFNFVYPCLMVFMLLVASVAQALTCFSRSQATSGIITSNGSEYINMKECHRNLFSLVLFGDILILVSYFWGLYSYRYSNPEHLSCLIETVFLSFNTRLVRRSQKKLVIILLSLLFMGIGWIVFSLLVSIARLYQFHPFDSADKHIYSFQKFFGNKSEEMDVQLFVSITTVIAVIGFIFFDLLYVAVVINYCSQCQLLCHYVTNVTEKIRHKAYALGDAIKEIYRVSEFLQVLNGTVAFVTGLVFFVFVQGTIVSYIHSIDVESGDTLGIVIAVSNICQWFSASLLPLIMAARLTGKCKKLKKVCLEVGARPFVYLDTPQLVLDSFLLYTLSTNYRAKLGCVAVHPDYVVLFFFILLLLFTIATQFAPFQFAVWI